ncbi:DivIVA domain-containing protein [Pseudarthrobacter enclensis]|uniref:DivIVA domain-containing protein n=1 Tax=Pseudarthrobacter enclensis TaxID=993070 RepID=UPI00342314D6
MSFFLVFLAIVLVGAVLWASLGLRPRRNGRQPLPAVLDGGFEQPPANLPPVLLPAPATPGDIDKVRFSLGLRGYRMDQVDQVLDDLRDQLAAACAEADRLRARIRDLEEGAGSGAGEPEAPDGGTSPSVPDGQ